jgi:hypothetical protein
MFIGRANRRYCQPLCQHRRERLRRAWDDRACLITSVFRDRPEIAEQRLVKLGPRP